MYQDPSIGKIKVYYVVTKIIVMESIEQQVPTVIHFSCSEKLDY